jgi:hypothetical protein
MPAMPVLRIWQSRDGNVFEVAERFRAELDGVAFGRKFATAGGDVAARQRAGGLEAEGVVAALDIAVPDAYILAGIEVNAVVIDHPGLAGVDGDAFDGGIAGLEEIHRPRARIGQVNIPNCDVRAAQPAHQKRADGVTALNGFQFPALSVNYSRAFDADMTRTDGNNQSMAQGDAVASLERIKIAIVGGIRTAEQHRILVEA